jgi:hypothetical protein
MDEKMTINELLVLMRRVKERVKQLEVLRSQNTSSERWIRATEVDRVVEPKYDVKLVDKKIMELENFLFRTDAAIKQANAITKVDVKVDVDALLSPIE